jgi:uncharacterized phage protein gp47/JayE
MPYQRPTLKSLFSQAAADVAESSGNFVLLRTSPLRILAKVAAGLIHGVYGYIDWLARMAVPVTAEGEYRQAWAELVGITQKPAATAAGTALFSGTPGSVMPEGTRLARSADGVAFVSTTLATVGSDSIVAVPVAAVEPGAGGNTIAGAALVIAGAISGINATGSVSTAIAGGADLEVDEAFQARMLERYREPPQGGAAADYEAWAKAVPGITRAWCTPNGAGAGTVVVYIMLDDAQVSAGGFPQGSDGVAAAETRAAPATGDQLVVANALYPLRPVTALVFVVAPVAFALNLTIADLDEDGAEIRAAIATALRGMLRRQAAPGAAIYPNQISDAIGTVAGVTRFTITAPVGPVTPPTGGLVSLGSITWS